MKKYDVWARVISNQRIANDIYSLRLHCPEIAKSIEPGQFVQLDCGSDFLTLRRPFSVFLVEDEALEILYQIVGKGTEALSQVQPESDLQVLGPLGKGWPIEENAKRALLVAGGIGIAPLGGLIPLLEEAGCEVDLAQGAQSEDKVLARDYFLARNCTYTLCTDDGSAGLKGFVTTPVQELISKHSYDVAYVCGPEAMIRNVVPLLREKGIKTYVSLERRMACGLGACLSCSIKTKKSPKQVCKAGPVFDAERIEW